MKKETDLSPYISYEIYKRINSAVGWFYVIAAASVFNSVMALFTKSNFIFLVGLGFTQLVDGFAIGFSRTLQSQYSPILTYVAFAVDLVIAAVFVLLGYFSKQKLSKATYLIGLILYGLDAAIFLFYGIISGLVLHGIALFFLLRGYISLRNYSKLDKKVIKATQTAHKAVEIAERGKVRPNVALKVMVPITIGLSLFGLLMYLMIKLAGG